MRGRVRERIGNHRPSHGRKEVPPREKRRRVKAYTSRAGRRAHTLLSVFPTPLPTTGGGSIPPTHTKVARGGPFSETKLSGQICEIFAGSMHENEDGRELRWKNRRGGNPGTARVCIESQAPRDQESGKTIRARWRYRTRSGGNRQDASSVESAALDLRLFGYEGERSSTFPKTSRPIASRRPRGLLNRIVKMRRLTCGNRKNRPRALV